MILSEAELAEPLTIEWLQRLVPGVWRSTLLSRAWICQLEHGPTVVLCRANDRPELAVFRRGNGGASGGFGPDLTVGMAVTVLEFCGITIGETPPPTPRGFEDRIKQFAAELRGFSQRLEDRGLVMDSQFVSQLRGDFLRFAEWLRSETTATRRHGEE